MSAIESLILSLAGPDGGLGRQNFNARVYQLAIQWPSLAAAIGEVLEEHSLPVPGPVRHAQNVMKQEREKGLRR